jgi:hypothetical protein
MPGGGSKKGERRGGRPKGSLNKRTIGIAEQIREMIKGKPARSPRAPDFDSLAEMRTSAKLLKNVLVKAYEKYQAGQLDAETIRKQLIEYLKACAEIAPYEYSKLASVTLKTLPVDPMKLTDEQLATLEYIIAASSDSGADPSGEAPTLN